MQVAFYKGKSRLFNKLTSWWLRGDFSHCELILEYDVNGLAVCASSSFMDEGVRTKHIKINPDNWVIIEIQAEKEQAWKWLNMHEHQPYDVLGLLGFILRRIGHKSDRWICSEAVAAMLGMTDPWRFDPCSLYAALNKREYI